MLPRPLAVGARVLPTRVRRHPRSGECVSHPNEQPCRGKSVSLSRSAGWKGPRRRCRFALAGTHTRKGMSMADEKKIDLGELLKRLTVTGDVGTDSALF